MTRDENIKYLTLALNMTGMQTNPEATEIILACQDKVIEKQGGVTIEDVSKIMADVQERSKNKSKIIQP